MSPRFPLSAAAAAVLLGAAAAPCRAQAAAPPSPVLVAMRQELARSLDNLKRQPTPPYFIGYEITEAHSVEVKGSFGTVTSSNESRRRLLGMDLRVGTPAFDNSHTVAGGMPSAAAMFGRFNLAVVPLDDDTIAIRRVIWHQTDRAYKQAVEQLARAKTSAQLRVAPEDTSPDFSPEPPVTHRETPADVRVDRRAWEAKVKAYTAPFARHGDIYDGEAHLTVEGETRWYVNSEGSELQTSSAYYRLVLSAYTRAEDGMVLPRYESFVASTPEGLPDDAAVQKAVEKIIADLHALKRAPVVTAATAPAILSGRASGVFFHEVFGHRVEGHRQKDEDEAQTFKGKVGERLLPPELSVYFDPTQQTLGGVELAGHYRYDNEGVAARRVDVVRNGIFRGFLMSRSPIAGFSRSNGHGRRQAGMPAVARQSNLVVTSSKPVSRATLKRMLLDEIKRQGKPFGLIFDDIEGGFTMTTRFSPNAFEVIPVMVYRVFPDGREELVRGVDLIGTPLTAFSRIIAADDVTQVFNGVCGAESGAVPVSAASPAILVSQIEVQRKPKAQNKAPILPPPAATAAAATQESDAVDRAMRDELSRSMKELGLGQLDRPYFIAYRVRDEQSLDVSATHGSLLGAEESRVRRLETEVRVGDYAFDNSNFFDVGGFGMIVSIGGASFGFAPGDLPLDDDYREVRRKIWLATDQDYKQALETIAAKRAALLNRARRDSLPDFSREAPTRTTDEMRPTALSRVDAETLVRELSGLPELSRLDASSISLAAGNTRARFLNSEGTSIVSSRPLVSVSATGSTHAVDGQPLAGSIRFLARSVDALPPRDALARAVRTLAARLDSLRAAPVLDRYAGPVLFEGQAAAELFAEVFAPALVGRRRVQSGDPRFSMMLDREGRDESFTDKLGRRVLPEFLSVVDDPTASQHRGEPLLGAYAVDDEGVGGRRKALVDAGVLKTLLTTRTPIEGIPQSSGNRRGEGAAPSNLLVEAANSLSEAQLKDRLLSLVKRRGLPYGVLVRELGSHAVVTPDDLMDMIAAMRDQGGGGRGVFRAYRVYPDGREELVRGAVLGDVDVQSFKDIVAVSATASPYHHAAVSGGQFPMGPMWFLEETGSPTFPVASYVVPSLLFEDLSFLKPAAEQPKPPLSPPPGAPPR